MGIFASEEYLAGHSESRLLSELKEHDIIGHTTDFVSFRNVRANQRHVLEYFSAAAGTRSVVRINPVANHFAAAGLDLGLALLAAPFAQTERLVQALPQETVTINVWLLRRRESDLRKLTREVRRFLEAEFATSRGWLAGTHRNARPGSSQGLNQLTLSVHVSLDQTGRTGPEAPLCYGE
jgi:DNA-binding transcriptional LysR family regulator